jgi:hypothetical protein
VKNMNLPRKLPSGKSWTRVSEFDESTSMDLSADHGAVSFKFYIDGSVDNLRELMGYMLGYGTVISAVPGSPSLVFNPNNAAAQGPWRLSRVPPARHPDFPNLRCTRIQSVTGKAMRNKVGEGARATAAGTSGEWLRSCVTAIFEIPKWPIKTNDENATALLGAGGTPLPEYLRHCEFEYESNFEMQARKGQQWRFTFPAANVAQPNGFIGDRLLRQAKGVLIIRWHDVPRDWIMLGKTIPSNFVLAMNRVNALPFPEVPYRNQNKAIGQLGAYVQFPPGTLLMASMPKITDRTMNHSVIWSENQIAADLVEKSCDVEIRLLHFDPPTDDTTTVDVSNYGGDAATLVRGHNVAPLAKKRQGAVSPNGTWYTVQDGPGGVAAVDERDLLYQYSRFDLLFGMPQSFS